MSWNAVLTFAKGFSPGQLEAVLSGFTRSEKATSFEEATSMSSQGIAVGTLEIWTVMCHYARLPFPDEALLMRASAAGRALVLYLGGTGDVYGMRIMDGGQLAREQIVSEGETVQESGEPIPEEAALMFEYHDEDWLFGLMEAVTTLTLNDLMPLPFELWSAET